MFTLRPDQVTTLARNANAGQLLAEFAKRGLQGLWEERGDEVQLLDPRGYISRVKLDEHGRIGEAISPTGERQQFTYDARQRLAAYRAPAGLLLQWTYDDADRLTSLTRNENQRWLFETNQDGDLTGIIYPDGTSTRMAYHGAGKLVAYKDRANETAYFQRDSLSRVIAVIDARGSHTRYSYSQWDQPDAVRYPDGTVEEHRRDAAGKLISATVNGTPWAQITWDDANILKRIDYGGGHFVEFSCDSSKRVTEARNPNSTVTRKYDDRGRLVEENQNGEIVRFGYDAGGLLRSLTNPAGEAVRFAYDPEGRLASIVDWSGKKHSMEYERAGQVIRQRLASGAITEIRGQDADRPESIALESPQGVSFKLEYEYNLNGQIAVVNDSEAGSKQYRYNAEERLLGVTGAGGTQQLAYDASGNCTYDGSRQAVFNSANQLVAHGAEQLAYDARGNLVQVSGPKGTTRYSYNGQNLLVTAELADGRRIEFSYDAFARRISKSVDGVVTRYVWAGDQLLCETTEGGGRASRCDYLFFPFTHIPFALRRDGRIFCYHTDALGTPRWLTSESGKIVWSADYLAFGTIRAGYQEVTQPLRFQGHYYDDETGLHYNRARYYSPIFGRYLSRDPIGWIAGMNLYTYAHNNPVNQTDALGLLSGWGKFAVGALIAVAGIALVCVAAPVVLAAVAGAAVTAATAAAVVGVVAGGALIGAGIGLALAPDGCFQCQLNAMLKGALSGAMAAFAVMTLPFMGPMGPAFALAGGGTLAAAITAETLANATIGAAITSTIVTMSTTGTGSGSGQSSQSSTRKGGPHKETSKPTNDGTDSHHTPAKDAYKGTHLDPDDGPAIKMDPKDHRLTASYGSSEEAEAYREAQRELIQKGEFDKAVEMDVKDIQSKFGNKYDDAIKEMLDYAKKIDSKTLHVKP